MKRRRLIIALSATSGVLVGFLLLFLILGLTVFKPKDPLVTVNSIALRDMDFSIDLPRLRAYLNVSLETNLNVTNPNRVGFKYGHSTAVLKYRGNDVGAVPIAAGRIGAGSSATMNLTLTLMADRLMDDSEFFSDVLSGTIDFQTHARLSGKVRLLFINIHVVAYATCDLEIHPFSRNLVNQMCRYKSKL